MADAQRDKIRAVIAPAVEAAGYELVEIEFGPEQGRWILRLYIDAAGGVSLEDCERVSHEISTLLDVSDVIAQAYTLEVSSPGLNRPLRSIDHFRRFIGQEAKVKLKRGIDGRRNFTGKIVQVEEPDNVIIEASGTCFKLPLSDLDKANLQYRFE